MLSLAIHGYCTSSMGPISCKTVSDLPNAVEFFAMLSKYYSVCDCLLIMF